VRAAISRVVTSFITSPGLRSLLRLRAGLSRALHGGRPRVEYFHQVDDPYSHLLVQVLPQLVERYGLDLRTWVVSPPDDAAAPERERLRVYGLRDAPRLASVYGLNFPQTHNCLSRTPQGRPTAGWRQRSAGRAFWKRPWPVGAPFGGARSLTARRLRTPPPSISSRQARNVASAWGITSAACCTSRANGTGASIASTIWKPASQPWGWTRKGRAARGALSGRCAWSAAQGQTGCGA